MFSNEKIHGVIPEVVIPWSILGSLLEFDFRNRDMVHIKTSHRVMESCPFFKKFLIFLVKHDA